MPETLTLIPRGKPSPGCTWATKTTGPIVVEREDADNWYGRPVRNPRCPTIRYPKFAWQVS